MIVCCAPLIYQWLLTHIPKKGPFVEQSNVTWPQRMGSVRAIDISWYSRDYDVIEIV